MDSATYDKIAEAIARAESWYAVGEFIQFTDAYGRLSPDGDGEASFVQDISGEDIREFIKTLKEKAND